MDIRNQADGPENHIYEEPYEGEIGRHLAAKKRSEGDDESHSSTKGLYEEVIESDGEQKGANTQAPLNPPSESDDERSVIEKFNEVSCLWC